MRDPNPELDLGGIAPGVQKGTSEGVEENPDKPTLRNFSKEFSQAERDKTAEEIWAKRKEHFGKKTEASKEIENLTKEGCEKKKSAEEVAKEIEELENSIISKKQNKILEFFGYFKIRNMEENLGIKKLARDKIETDYATLEITLQDLNQNMQDKTKLLEAKNTLNKFYAGQEIRWNEYQEDQKERDVKNISKKYNATFIHGIHPNFLPSDNSMLENWVDWKTKLKILTTFEPTISTSTIKEGDDWKRMWSRMGVILSGGSIESASFADQGSRARGIKERENQQSGPIHEQIEKAIMTEKDPNQLGYNELVVKNPEISGFYVCLDETNDIIKRDMVFHSEIAETAAEMRLKLYAIQGGVVYEAEYDKVSKKIIPKKKDNQDQILSEKYGMSEERKNVALHEIFEDSPFKIKSPELSFVNSSGYGKQYFISLLFESGELQGKKMEYNGDAYTMKTGDKINVIDEIPIIGQKLRIFEIGGKIYQERKETHTGKIHTMSIGRDEIGYSKRHINIGWMTHDLKRDIKSNQDYLSAMEDSIMDVSQQMEDFEKKKQNWDDFNRDQMERILDNWLRDLAFHAYGFAEEAGKFGDNETRERAEKIASRVLSKEYYYDVIKRRIDSEGRLKITERDLD